MEPQPVGGGTGRVRGEEGGRVVIDELPVSTDEARRILGCGRTRISAIKRAMGIQGHRVFVGAVGKGMTHG